MNAETIAQCGKCGVSKPLNAFRKERRTCKECVKNYNKQWRAENPEYFRQYHESNSEQRNQTSRRWRAENVERAHARAKIWRIANVGHIKLKGDQWRKDNPEYFKKWQAERIEQVKQYRAQNSKRRSEQSRKWRAENPERLKDYREKTIEESRKRRKDWRAKNPGKVRDQWMRRRASKFGALGSHTYIEWCAMVDRFGGHCVCCKKQFELRLLTEDHVVPLAWGGTDFIENIQPLCGFCNRSKGDRHATDYRVTYSPV